MRAAVWFRNDLRTLDHPALNTAASNHQQLRAVYFLCPKQLDEHVIAPIRRHYLRRAVDELGEQLRKIAVPLDIIVVPDFAQVPDALYKYCSEHQLDAVYAHREHLPNELQRDRACRQKQIPLQLIDDELINPAQISKDNGEPYKVFTPFSRRCRDALLHNPPHCKPRPKPLPKAALTTTPCPAFGEEQDSTDWPVTEKELLSHLREFCSRRASRYRDERDFPALHSTSRLSAPLSLGLISARQCLSRLQLEAGEAIHDPKSGPGCWLNELLWREFYRYVAYHFPRVAKGKAFQAHTEALQWRNNETEFAAWCEGRTGYPIVDAAMRQLNQTGWMHNRLRMICASFLCKDLQIDWRWGERYFLSHLIDADFCSNNGGWQWAASTGTDAAPYFRIFNPTSQSQRFDPDGAFLRQYLPELADRKPPDIHSPKERTDYTPPIVDHQLARNATLTMFDALKCNDNSLS
jgi:deoxyribodipyrimidine photo-lyase